MINVYRGWDIEKGGKLNFRAIKRDSLTEYIWIAVADTIEDLKHIIDQQEYERAQND